MKKTIISLLCIIMVFSSAFSLPTAAESFDLGRHGSITVHYTDGTQGFENLEIKAYRVAQLDNNGVYGTIAPFSDYNVHLNDISSQSEWKNAADTMASYIIADGISPYCLIGTDHNGTVVMENMETGLYLILAVNAERDGTVYAFENFFVVLPRNENNGWDYDVEAVPKKSQFTGHINYCVMKLWKDSGHTENRPEGITVDIFRNGVLHDTQVLNDSNNWVYAWQDADGKGVWTVAEKDVPESYSVVVAKKENIFNIVNTYDPPHDDDDDKPEPPPPPPTGDTPIPVRYFMIMCISGLAMVVLGISIGRKKE